jgi:peptidoglycan L-alanyl-D-glutamate endopeptidase CwlK
MSRKIEDLDSRIGLTAVAFLDACKAQGLPVILTHTRRTLEEQAQLYAQGRTVPGMVVTRAKPGQSPHNYGLAFDVVFLDLSTPNPSDITWDVPGRDDEWEAIGKIGESLGLAWGGRFSRPDRPHFEHPDWKRLADV